MPSLEVIPSSSFSVVYMSKVYISLQTIAKVLDSKQVLMFPFLKLYIFKL